MKGKRLLTTTAVILQTAALCLLSACSSVPQGYLAERETGLMFDEEGDFVSIYNYCPSVLVEGDNAYVWYCSNESSGAHGDHIAYRKGVRADGKWYWGEKQIILGPKAESYYSGNICDPDVIKGEFGYKGETYSYLMTVLGCKTVDNSSNMFGFFVAKSPDGPWLDVPEISPLYDFYDYFPDYVYDGATNFNWGWGQSSLISVDKKGKVLLFYTGRSGTGQKVECWDFSDLEHPVPVYEAEVSNRGIYTTDGKQDSICNAQFMFDGAQNRYYMVCDTHPFSEFEVPTNLPYASNVYYFDVPEGVDFWEAFKNKITWSLLFSVDYTRTGFPRNHNCCFFRDAYGFIPISEKIDLAYTMSVVGADWKVLYTYRIYHLEYKF